MVFSEWKEVCVIGVEWWRGSVVRDGVREVVGLGFIWFYMIILRNMDLIMSKTGSYWSIFIFIEDLLKIFICIFFYY